MAMTGHAQSAAADIDQANQVILFYPLPGNLKSKAKTSLWNNLPAVSEDYEKARKAIVIKVKALIDSLEKH
jgi:hypothetical protein